LGKAYTYLSAAYVVQGGPLLIASIGAGPVL